MDNHSKSIRSKNMSHISSVNTKPEEIVCKFLFHSGFRYRKNYKTMPGKPDIVLRKYKTVIFINGCFWHKHDCGRFVWPASNIKYWRPKIEGNVRRDKVNQELLKKDGWHAIVVWECELKKSVRDNRLNRLIKEICSNNDD